MAGTGKKIGKGTARKRGRRTWTKSGVSIWKPDCAKTEWMREIRREREKSVVNMTSSSAGKKCE